MVKPLKRRTFSGNFTKGEIKIGKCFIQELWWEIKPGRDQCDPEGKADPKPWLPRAGSGLIKATADVLTVKIWETPDAFGWWTLWRPKSVSSFCETQPWGKRPGERHQRDPLHHSNAPGSFSHHTRGTLWVFAQHPPYGPNLVPSHLLLVLIFKKDPSLANNVKRLNWLDISRILSFSDTD